MTLPASGNILLGTAGGGNSVNSEFGYGNDMASYLGVYYGKGTQEFRFPLPGNSIGMNGFYSTFKITGSNTYLGTGYWTVPVYNTLYAQVKGGDGGGAGQWGYNACTGQATGSAGGQNGTGSSFGGYVSAGGGGGGGGNGGGGGAGQTSSSSFTNPVQGGAGPTSGSQVYVSVGPGGGGGGGGSQCAYYGIYCLCPATAGSGGPGAAGYVYVSWA